MAYQIILYKNPIIYVQVCWYIIYVVPSGETWWATHGPNPSPDCKEHTLSAPRGGSHWEVGSLGCRRLHSQRSPPKAMKHASGPWCSSSRQSWMEWTMLIGGIELNKDTCWLINILVLNLYLLNTCVYNIRCTPLYIDPCQFMNFIA